MRVAVIQLARDCRTYYVQQFPRLWEQLQTALKNQAYFFCVENASRDDTACQAQRFGHVLSLPASGVSFLTQRCTARTAYMAALRNQAVRWVMEFGPFDYFLWLDTNVTFTTSTITRLWETIDRDPTIGLAGANTLQVGHKAHYYDTYALNTPGCLWRECDTCHGPHAITNTVDVYSAFGGLCFTRPHGTFAADSNQCEHVYLCTKLREQGYRVVVVGAARATWTP
jgi:hypothetical protein